MKEVLVLGLGGQGKKYLNYFIKNNYDVFGVCKTVSTKEKIEEQYKIHVFLEYQELDLNTFDIIIICLPPEIQGKISLDILKQGFKKKLIIEIPVTWSSIELEEIKTYQNAIFYLEEYYTLLSQFLRKVDVNKIDEINIQVLTNKADYENLLAREVTYVHIKNNFLGLDTDNINYIFDFHDSENIFYTVYFKYNGTAIEYCFHNDKYLKIGVKKYIDDYNFDNVLTKIIVEPNNFSKYYII